MNSTKRGKGEDVTIVASRMRLEERLILEALERRDVGYRWLDPRRVAFTLQGRDSPAEGRVLMREVAHTRSLYAALLLQMRGHTVVNRPEVIDLCGDKLKTAVRLQTAGLPIPQTAVGLAPAAGLESIRSLDYPVVVKPVLGSWGRLVARVWDAEGAECLVEHRAALANPQNKIVLAQEHVDKPGRDIKAYVVGRRVVAAIYKISDHWRTNTALGGRTQVCPVTPELELLLQRASAAVGGGILGIDVLERPDGALLINEVNHTPEFHGANEVLDVSLADAFVDHLLSETASPALSVPPPWRSSLAAAIAASTSVRTAAPQLATAHERDPCHGTRH